MYNSIIVSFFVRLWKFIEREYEKSFIKKMIDSIKKIFSYIGQSSYFKRIFTSSNSLIEKSFVYHIYKLILKLLNKILNLIRRFIGENSYYSIAYRNINNLFKTKVEVIRTFSVFILSFGLGIGINNILRGYTSGKSYIVAIMLVIASLIALSIKENYKKVLGNSWFYSVIVGLFAIDEGGDNWW